MPPKKKVVNTEELTEKTEEQTEETIKQKPSNEEVENIQKPKKPKRKMTEKQQENFAKLQLANKVRYEAKRKLKEEETNNKITEVEVKQEEIKPTPKPVIEKTQEVEEEEEEEVVVKKKPVKKKKKKIVIEQDSSSDSEEIVISRRRGRKKSKPIDIPVPEPMIDITPIEEKKVETKKEEEDLNKKYSAKQILKSLGL